MSDIIQRMYDRHIKLFMFLNSVEIASEIQKCLYEEEIIKR